MKRILGLGLSILLSLPLISTTVVAAERTNTGLSGGAGDSNKTQVKPTVVAAETTSQTGTDDSKNMQTRLDKRVAELKIKLSAAEKANIQAKCKAAQGSVSSVRGRVKGIETSRTEVYSNIVSRLTELSAKLKNKGADTKMLDADIAALQSKIATFKTDLAVYKQTVSDLEDMDCKTQPDGFKASLLAARTALETVNKDAGAVHSYVNDTIKPELKTIRASLENNKTERGQ